jgi:hypothetical protein
MLWIHLSGITFQVYPLIKKIYPQIPTDASTWFDDGSIMVRRKAHQPNSPTIAHQPGSAQVSTE